uniref:Tetratricopeptide repeat protein 30 n=1 Tax=Macrostomum lignano TaxID=282301 RepID=A0A1I8IBE5_9PLAT
KQYKEALAILNQQLNRHPNCQGGPVSARATATDQLQDFTSASDCYERTARATATELIREWSIISCIAAQIEAPAFEDRSLKAAGRHSVCFRKINASAKALVRSVGQHADSARVSSSRRAFNLKTDGIEFTMRNRRQAAGGADGYMPPRSEAELDACLLRRKLLFLACQQQPSFRAGSAGATSSSGLYIRTKYYDLAADSACRENTTKPPAACSQLFLLDFLEGRGADPRPHPELAYQKLEPSWPQIRLTTCGGSQGWCSSVEFCSEHDTWKLNVAAHVLLMAGAVQRGGEFLRRPSSRRRK